MNKLKVIIVDDEESARDVLENLLLLFCEDIEVLAKCSNIPDAVGKIKTLVPDIVFLDIEMPKYAGYEIVNFIDDIQFDMIFVTAYDQYAIKAFEIAAIDYLLKPVDIERLRGSIERVREKQNRANQAERLELLKHSMDTKEIKNLLVFDKAQQHVISFESIIAIEAQESYCIIHTTDKKHFVSKNLAHYEKTLEGINCFFRVHRSWMVNKQHITSFSKTDLTIIMTGQLTTKLSKYRKMEFEAFLLS